MVTTRPYLQECDQSFCIPKSGMVSALLAHRFFMLIEGRHNIGKGHRVFTNDQRLPTDKNELFDLCLEVECWMLLTQCKQLHKTLAVP